jgi:hypothetical protein
MIEDIKVVQIYDWRYDEEAQKYIWVPTIYNLHIKLNGSWRPVEVEHLNPEPTTPEPEAEP